MFLSGSTDIEIVWGGKLPSHGDFLWSNPRSAVRAQLEDWLQTGMQQGRSQFGDAWRDHLERAPVWNFLLPTNVTQQDVMVAGCLAPSADRVGRQYPFIVGYAFPQKVLMNTGTLLMELPTLMNLAGHQLHTAIRRSLPRTVLESIWINVLGQWRSGLAPCTVLDTECSEAGSDILDVLGSNTGLGLGDNDMTTRPAVRESAYPWPDIGLSLQSSNCPSFWWTHPAGGAPLKALAYESQLDGPLMTWLFGRGKR